MASNSPKERKRLARENGGMASISTSTWHDNARRRFLAFQPARDTPIRENRLKAAIRRMQYGKNSMRVEPDDGGNDGQATAKTYLPGANDRG